MQRYVTGFLTLLVFAFTAPAGAIAQNSIDVQDAAGDPSSAGNIVRVDMTNEVVVGAIQFTLRNVSPDIEPTEVRLGGRFLGHNFIISENIFADGDSVRIVIWSATGDSLEAGDGTIADVLYRVGPGATPGNTVALTLNEIVVSDPSGGEAISDGTGSPGIFTIRTTLPSTLSATPDTTNLGDNGLIVVSLDNQDPNRPVNALQFTLADTPNNLDLAGVTAVGRASGFNITANETENGLLIAIFSLSGPLAPGIGPIAKISYTAARGEGATTLNFIDVVISDVDAIAMPQGTHTSGSFFVNHPPVAEDDSTTTVEDTPVTIHVLTNDSDGNGNDLTISKIIQPTYGTVVRSMEVGPVGLIYTPYQDYNTEVEGQKDEFAYTADDGHGGKSSATVRVSVSAVNDKPEIFAHPKYVIDEDNELVFSSSLGRRIAVNDRDVGETENGTLKVNLAAVGSVILNPEGNVTITDGADSTSSITFTGDLEAINAAIDGLRYSPVEDASGEGAGSLSITVNDQGNTGGDPESAQHNILIDIRQVNDRPVLSDIESDTLSYEEDGGPVQVSATLKVSDAEGNIAGATVKIKNHAPGDLLSIDVGPVFIEGSFNSTTGILMLTGDATSSQYQQVLRSITYVSTSQNPLGGARLIVFRVGDGIAKSNEVSRQIDVTAINDQPEIVALDSVTAVEDAQLVFSSSNNNEINIVDLDRDVVEVTISVNSGSININRVTGVEVIQEIEDGGFYKIKFQGLVKNVNTALSGLIYTPSENVSGFPADALQLIVADKGNTGSGGVLIDNHSVAIHISSVNDAPVISAPATATVDEGDSFTFSNSDGTGVSIADIDAGDGDLSLEIKGPGSVKLSSIIGLIGFGDGSDSLSYTGKLSDLNNALSDMVYTPPTSEESLELKLNILVSDLGNTGEDQLVLSASATVQIGSNSVNDPPVIRVFHPNAPGGVRTNEDIPVIFRSNGKNRLLISDSDAGNGEILFRITSVGTITLGSIAGLSGTGDGTDSLVYTGTLADINTALDSLVYTPVPDTAGVQAGRFSVFVSDQGHSGDTILELTDEATVLFDISSVNDAPVITAPTIATTSEDDPLNFGDLTENKISVVDIDVGANDISIEITANRSVSFQSIDGLTGQGNGTTRLSYTGNLASINAALTGLIFTPLPDENGTGLGKITISVSDLGNSGDSYRPGSDEVSLTINVNPINDAPVLEGIETTPLVFQENSVPIPVTQTIVITDIDSDIIIGAKATLVDYESGIDVLTLPPNNDIEGTFDRKTGVLSLRGNAAVALYQAALRSVTYQNSSDNPTDTTRTVNFQIFDVEEDPGPGSNVLSREIAIIPINDAPFITTTKLAVGYQDIGYAFRFKATDPEGDKVTYSAPEEGTAWFQLDSETGAITGTPTVNDTGTYRIQISVSDYEFGTKESYQIRIEPDRVAPQFTSDPTTQGVTHSQFSVLLKANEIVSVSLYYSWQDSNQIEQSDSVIVNQYKSKHIIKVTDLLGSTRYRVGAVLRDQAGNLVQSRYFYVETLKTPDTTPPNFDRLPAAVARSHTSLTFAWSTDEAAIATVRLVSADSVDLEPNIVDSLTSPGRTGRVELTGLSPSTRYEGQIELADVNGNGVTADIAGRTRAAPDISPPAFVRTPAAHGITDSRADITSGTNEPAIITVQYGLTEEFGLILISGDRQVDEDFVSKPSLTLSGLEPLTTYYFRAKGEDKRGNESEFTPAVRFKTKAAPDTTAPQITAGPVVVSVTDKSLVVKYQTDELSNTILRYAPEDTSQSQSDIDTITVLDPTRVKEHVVTLNNLIPETLYKYLVSSLDGSGNISIPRGGEARTVATPDTIPPKFTTRPQVTAVSSDQITVRWNSDEASGSFGAADTTSTVLDDLQNTDAVFQVVDQSLVKTHTLTFSDLEAETRYYWRIAMADAKGNRVESPILNVRTKAAPDTTAPGLWRITSSAQVDRAIIEFATSEPGNSTIIYGPSYNAVSAAEIDSVELKSDSELMKKHVVTLTGLDPSTRYYYRVKSKDAAGNESEFLPVTPKDFKTLALPDTEPPKVSGISVSSLTFKEATITFNTNELSNTSVSFGLTSDDLKRVIEDALLVTDHQISLTNLMPATTYHFRVGAEDQKGNKAESPGSSNLPRTLTTKAAPDSLPPRFVNKPDLGYRSDEQVYIKFKTDEPTDANVFYKKGSDRFFVFTSDFERKESHSIQLTALERGVSYAFVVEVKDAAGNTAFSTGDGTIATKVGLNRFKIVGFQQGSPGRFTTLEAPDTQAPVILAPPSITSRDDNSITVQWATDELSTSTVDYGTDSNNLDQRYEEGALVTNHSVNITGLSPTTIYGYTVSSTDPSNNGPTISSASVVTTTAQPDVSPPVIETPPVASSTYVSVADGASATIVWTTDEPSDSKVEFGTSSLLGEVKSISEAVTSHIVPITRLAPETVYHFRVASTDQSGNGPVISNTATFTAENQPDTQAPVISNVDTSGTTNDRITVAWDTDELSTTLLLVIEQGTSDTIGVTDGTFLISHSLTVTQDNSGNALKSATTYSFMAESFDASGNGVSFNSSITTAAAPDTVAPEVPESVSAEAGNAQAQLSWDAVTDADLSGYDVFQDGSQIASGVTDTLYDVTGLDNGTSVEFTVRSVDNNGNASVVSSVATTTPLETLAPSAPTIAGTFDRDGNVNNSVSVKPILLVDNVTPVAGRSVPTYSFAVYGDSSLTNLVISTSGVVEGTSGNPTHWQVVDPTLPDQIALIDGTTYYWRARASDRVADGPWSPTATFIARSSEPVGVELAAFTAESDRGKVSLHWQTLIDLGVQGFKVYRSVNQNGPFEMVSAGLIRGRDGVYEFNDFDVRVNMTYYYQIEVSSTLHESHRHGPISVKVTPPNTYAMDQNYPNPFNPTTTIRYELPQSGHVELTVYNILGQEVRRLVDMQQDAGFHTIQWNGLNAVQNRVSSGVYLYRIAVRVDGESTFSTAMKMLLVK